MEAPVAGLIILAGVLLKLGGYGWYLFIRILKFPFQRILGLILILGIFGGLLTIMVCFRQVDLKCFIAYSSVSHMELVISSFSIISFLRVWGGTLILLAHGLVSSGIFYGLNLFYERFFSRRIIILKGFLVFSINRIMVIYYKLNKYIKSSFS